MRSLPPAVLFGGAAVVALAAIGVALVLGEGGGEDVPEDAVIVDVTTSRYAFTPGSAEPINVTKGTLVVFRVTSTDVTHGFAIEGYGVNEPIPAGQTVEIRVRATQAGEFTIYCNVFCGSGHPGHKGTLHVA